MVRKRDLCAHNAVDENEIPLYAAAEGGGGVAVGAGEHIAVHALFRQGVCLGINRFQAAGDAVRSEKTHGGGDAGSGKIRQAGFRRTGGKAVLTAAGTSLDKVVKTVCFLSSMEDFAAFNGVYGKYFTGKPARSCVAVKTLPKNVLVEVDTIAEV